MNMAFQKVDNFGNAMFISASLYNRNKVIGRLNKGYQYTYSCAPHLLLAIASLSNDGLCLFSEKQLVSRQLVVCEEQRSSVVVVTIGLTTILELPMMSPRIRRLLALAIEKSALSLRDNARELYYMAHADGDFDRAKYLYDQVAHRLYYFDRSLKTALRVWAYRLVLVYPRTFGWVNRFSARLTGRVIEEHSTIRRVD